MGFEMIDTPYGQMPTNYITTTLGAVCGKGGVQTGPFGSQLHNEDYVSVGTPIVTVEHLGENRFTHQNLPMVSDQDKRRLSKYTLKPGDIVFSRVGSVDRRAIVRAEEDGWMFSGRCLRVRTKSESVDPTWLSHFFGLESFREYIRAVAVGATMPSINTSILSSVPLYLPPISQQRATAEFLDALDDRIDLLRQTNATLEAIAQALFKSWFVDFDPVRTKAEGREPEAMDAATAALFPIEFEESELGLIPVGWRVEEIGKVISSVGGGTPSTKEPSYWDESVHHWVTPKDLSGLQAPVLINTGRKVSAAGLAKISSGLLPLGTLLLSSRAPIGYLVIAYVPTAINQGFIAMLPGGELPTSYLLFWTRINMNEIKQKANGSTFMEISKSSFRTIKLCVPPSDIVGAFDSIARPLLDRIAENERQSEQLAQIRNTLLPRFVSGKLHLKTEDNAESKSAGVT